MNFKSKMKVVAIVLVISETSIINDEEIFICERIDARRRIRLCKSYITFESNVNSWCIVIPLKIDLLVTSNTCAKRQFYLIESSWTCYCRMIYSIIVHRLSIRANSVFRNFLVGSRCPNFEIRVCLRAENI